MTALFDTYLIVDWSAANAPKRGKDSIWIGEVRRERGRLRTKAPINVPTRSEAIARLTALFNKELDTGRRVFAGFDFPFGYPEGAAMLIAGKASWRALWATLAAVVEDDDANRSNRYVLADRWNAEIFETPHYWGRPHQHRYANIGAKKPTGAAFKQLEYRVVERWRPPAKSVWQLAYNGAVGSQAILGMARLKKLRGDFNGACAVWPFETRWAAALEKPIVIAEVYPSMFKPAYKSGDVKDAAQVRTAAKNFAAFDDDNVLARVLSRPPGLSNADSKAVLREEGWIAGAGHPETDQ